MFGALALINDGSLANEILDEIESDTPSGGLDRDFLGWIEPVRAIPPIPSDFDTEQTDDLSGAYESAARQPGRVRLLDVSAPGTGKSYASGLLTPEILGVAQVILASAEHRNPTTETLKDWPDLESRHSGLWLDGFGRLRRVTIDQPWSVGANCARAPLIARLRDLGVTGADEAGTVCSGCPLLARCATGSGEGFGYLYQRRKTLLQPRFRAHLDSLPDPENHDYSRTALVVDEGLFEVLDRVTVSRADVLATAGVLAGYPGLDRAKQLLLHMDRAITAAPSPYGLGSAASRELLADLTDWTGTEITAVLEALDPDLTFLRLAPDGTPWRDLPASVRGLQHDGIDPRVDQIPTQWVNHFFRALQSGVIRFTPRGIEICNVSDRNRRILQAVRVLIVQDATANPGDLAVALGVSRRTIKVIAKAQPDHGNLTVIQIPNLGVLGSNRTPQRAAAAAEVVKHYKGPETAVIGWKSLGNADGSFYVDTRGVNHFSGKKRLLIDGLPIPNLGAILDKYQLLYDRTATLESPGFQSYLARTVRAELTQLIGRLRANRRPGEQLEVIILGHRPGLEYPGAILIDSNRITVAASLKKDQTRAKILLVALDEFFGGGKMPTAQTIADRAGVSLITVKRIPGGMKSLKAWVKGVQECQPPDSPQVLHIGGVDVPHGPDCIQIPSGKWLSVPVGVLLD